MLDEARIDAIFEEINQYTLELANDPSSLGPQYFQDIIAECRNYLNKVSLILSELDREKLKVSGKLRALEAAYTLEYNNLMANDDRVRTLANVEDRKSTASFHLREQKAEIDSEKDRLHVLDSVHKAVTHRSRELHSTMTAIKDQRRLLQTILDTGAFYGDERVPQGKKIPKEGAGMSLDDDDLGENEIAEMFSDSELETENSVETQEESPAEAQESPAETVAEKVEKNDHAPEDADVVQFLGSKAQEVAAEGETDEMTDVMSMLDSL